MTDPPPFARLSSRAVLALILTFGFCLRAATFQSPLLDHQGWRQSDTAAIARAFTEERYNVFYPQVDWRGAADTGYVQTGLELHAFLVASIARFSGFRTEIGRLLSALFFLFSCSLVWAFTRRRYGVSCGLLAAYLYAFGFPLMLFMERAFMNEALLVCLSLASLVAAQRYLDPDARHAHMRRRLALASLCATTALVGAIKAPYLIVLAPVSGLFIERDGWRALGRPALLLAWTSALGATAAWYVHAHGLGEASGLTFGTFDKIGPFDLVLSERFYRMVSQRTFRDILGPIGLVGLFAGAWHAWHRRGWAELLGLAGFVFYVLVVSGGNLTHDYYQLAIIPLAPTIVASGILYLIDRIPPFSRAYGVSVTTVLVLVALITTVRSASFHSWYEIPQADVQLCSLVPRHFSSPADRVIVLGSGDPRFLFCLNRKGWIVDGAVTEGRLRQAWEQGARVALIYPDALEPLLPFLRAHGEPIELMSEVRAYRLYGAP